MPDTFTPSYNFTKPEVGASRDSWGTKDNENWDKADTAIKSIADIVAAFQSLPPGAIIDFATAKVPNGWLRCNGAAISRTVYTNLFAEIGTSYGSGDGSTTFNLPDIRGLFRRGLDEGRGVDPGRALVAVQGSQNLSHAHNLTGGGLIIQLYGGGPTAYLSVGNPNNGYYAASIAADGGNEARPINIAFPTCIKY